MRREILIDSATPETRVALLEDDVLAEVFVERSSGRGLSGNIYKGRVNNVLPGMQAAFVDIGAGRDAFLYVQDVSGAFGDGLPPGSGEGDGTPIEVERPPTARIEDLLKEGQDILVQVTKDPVPEKGARLTSLVSLPGRFLVHLPGLSHIGVSRRIEEPAERDRLKALAAEAARGLSLPGGFIVRTAGEGRQAEDLRSEARDLVAVWDDIRRRAESARPPALLHQEAGAVTKVLRDVLNDDVHQVVVDGAAAHDEVVRFVSRVEPALVPRIRLHPGRRSLFEERGVQHQIDQALRARLWLRSGGSVVIQATEALVAVDVNTGKYVGTRRLEDTVLRTNLEAAVEIVRQIRLRDLGGIIVIDFIDMEEQASKEEVLRVLREEMRKDRSKSRMLQISDFGLVEITRQRTKRSLEKILCLPCPVCSGSGRLRSAESIAYAIQRDIRGLGPFTPGARVVARVHPEVAASLEGRPDLLGLPEGSAPVRFEVEPDPGQRHGQFHLLVREPS